MTFYLFLECSTAILDSLFQVKWMNTPFSSNPSSHEEPVWGQTNFGKERLRKITMSDMELVVALLIKTSTHTTNRKSEIGKRTGREGKNKYEFLRCKTSLLYETIDNFGSIPPSHPPPPWHLSFASSYSMQFPIKYVLGRKRRLTMLSDYSMTSVSSMKWC